MIANIITKNFRFWTNTVSGEIIDIESGILEAIFMKLEPEYDTLISNSPEVGNFKIAVATPLSLVYSICLEFPI